MKAYQYFHLPSGYVSRVSDNDSGTLNFIEEIRKTLQNSTFFVYFVNSKGLGIALNSKVDETKNQQQLADPDNLALLKGVMTKLG